MRDIGALNETFDACYLLWHSFGYFDDQTNEKVIASLSALLRSGGRMVVDLYNPSWVLANQGTQRRRNQVSTSQRVVDGRQMVEIQYGDGSVDRLDWRLYTPEDFAALAARHGFAEIGRGVWWDFSREITDQDARFQMALQRD